MAERERERGEDTTELCKTMKWLGRKLMLPVSENKNREHGKKISGSRSRTKYSVLQGDLEEGP